MAEDTKKDQPTLKPAVSTNDNVSTTAKGTPEGTQPQQNENPFLFTPDERTAWGTGRNMDTDICRAWARLLRRDIDVGSPTGDEYESKNKVYQNFQHAKAVSDKENNQNRMVVFRDGRGEIASESGL